MEAVYEPGAIASVPAALTGVSRRAEAAQLRQQAIGAQNAEFWPIAFGSSIQILATVLSPFTIAGEGIREAAQYVLLGNMIGPANAIVSAALGFWAAEALTLAGGFFWWVRPAGYTPAYCLVDGEQVDYEEAAKAAAALETEEEREKREAAPDSELPSLAARARHSGGLGLGAGVALGLGLLARWALPLRSAPWLVGAATLIAGAAAATLAFGDLTQRGGAPQAPPGALLALCLGAALCAIGLLELAARSGPPPAPE